MKKKDQVITFSVSQENIIYSEDARKHNIRLVSNYLKALEIPFAVGKCGEADYWEDEIFIVPADHEEAIKNLVKSCKQEHYWLSKPTNASNIREQVKMNDYGRQVETVQVIKVKKEEVHGLAKWYYDSVAKQYWAVTAKSLNKKAS